ncbi:MAG TPA: helix-turn-helix domain-containing protein [Pseudonocardiaceae bacterium]|nr:helix-turn-helix domain-containing protein [Pseudonocardiaceae bacterium]
MTDQREIRQVPFGRELRRIRGERGLSLARLAGLTHYSKGYLSKIETGMRPASADLARRLDDVLDARGHLVRLVVADRPSTHGDDCPYRGLAAFADTDAQWFFGRERATSEALEVIADALANRQPAIIVGPSGVGKSSLLHAGLLPSLARDSIPGSAGWPVLAMTPTADPCGELAGRTELLPTTADSRFVLVVDQFEELFTLCESEADRAAFVTELAGLAATRRALVVLTLRADFYGRCLHYPQLLAALRGNQVTIGPMNRAELRSAISGPAELAGLELAPGLVDLLLAEVGPGGLPLLSHALLATWQEREGHTLTVAGYRRTGGIGNAVAATAERVYAALPTEAREAARALLVHLVRVGDHEQDSRRRAYLTALRRQLPDPAGAEAAVEELAAARLLIVDAETVTIAHEALLHAWPRLHDWIESDRSGLRLHQQLREAADGWDREQRHPSLLYRGPRLALVADWAAGHQGRLGAVERDFLLAATAQEDAARSAARRQTRRLRRLVAGLVVMTALALVATFVALAQGNAATRQRDLAVSRALASESNELRLTDPSLATRLGLAAYRVADTPEARGSLLASAGDTQVRQLRGQPRSVTQIATTPDGRTVVTSGEDGTTRIWAVTAADTLDPVATIPGPAQVTTLAVGGNLLVTSGESGPTRLWRLGSRLLAAASLPAGSPVEAAAFSGDHAILALGHADGTIALWNASDPSHPVLLATLAASDAVRSLAFAPHALVLVSGDAGGTARLWDLSAAALPGTILATHAAAVRSVVFSPVGNTVAIGSDDHTIELWSLADAARPVRTAVLDGNTNAVHYIAFSSDGATVAGLGDDQTVALWDTATGARITTLDEPAPARGAAFADGNRLLVTGDDTGMLWLWRLPPPLLAGTAGVDAVAYQPHHAGGLAIGQSDGVVLLRSGGVSIRLAGGDAPVRAVAFTSGGDMLAAAGDDGVVRLWSLSAHPVLLSTFATGDAAVDAIAFAPGGDVLAAGGDSRVISLWSVQRPRTPMLLSRLSGHRNTVRGLAFSPDGHTLASASDDYSARLWNVRDPRHPGGSVTFPWLANAVNAVAFSPDGRIVATASDDHTVRLWDITTLPRPSALAVLTAHAGAVQSVAFSPDGRLLASTADDHTARLWDVGDPRSPVQLADLTGHGDVVGTVAFAPDGRHIATGSLDHSVRFWLSDPVDAARLICAASGPSLSADQWAQYAGDVPYRRLC